MARTAIPIRKLWRPVAVMSGPAVVVLAALAALQQIGWGPAVVGAMAAILGIGFVVRSALIDFESLRDYAEAAQRDPETPRPRLAFADELLHLLAAIRRLARARHPGGDAGITSIDRLSDPVLMVTAARRLVRANLAARDLLGAGIVGRDLAQVLRTPAVLEAVDALLDRDGGGEDRIDVEFSFQVPVRRHFSARIARLPQEAADGTALVIALYDLTAMKQSDRMRTDFIANASHELRTPISVILGCLQTLRGSARDDPEAQAEFFGLMDSQAQRMSRLVDDLLSLSRIELNEHAQPAGHVNLGEVVRQAASSLTLKADERGMTIAIDVADDLPEVPGDADDLVMAAQNLIDNAIKYGAEQSTITVSARPARESLPPALVRGGAHVALTVRDQGEGIAAEHIPRLTERFYRVDTARSRQMGGTGLGLAIVKHVTNRHRGALTIESTEGEGSAFTVWLPAREARAAATPRLRPVGGDGHGASEAAG